MNVHFVTRAVIGALALALMAPPLFADPPQGKGKGKSKHAEEAPIASGVSASVGPIRIDISFDQARRIAMDAGAHGYKPLPPGIRKNLARGKPLPPGIAKKYAPAPMIARLPAHPGHEWRVVGTDLVLVAIATAVVVDILIDVFS
jgi:hypothetical protein